MCVLRPCIHPMMSCTDKDISPRQAVQLESRCGGQGFCFVFVYLCWK